MIIPSVSPVGRRPCEQGQNHGAAITVPIIMTGQESYFARLRDWSWWYHPLPWGLIRLRIARGWIKGGAYLLILMVVLVVLVVHNVHNNYG
jgi:hypothetical protein